jgi:hypothetical protein
MKTEDIKSDLKIGKEIFDKIPNDVKPSWAGLILSQFDNYIKSIPTAIQELFPIIENQELWQNAHGQFTQIRLFNLANPNFLPNSYINLAEKVAKITYNSSGQLAPFDKDSGWFIPRLAIQTASFFNDKNLECEVRSSILIFNRAKILRKTLTASKDFLVYKKISNILWFDWDPIDINKIAPKDEYESYVPAIYNLKKIGSDRQQIAEQLLKFEIKNMGTDGTLDSCLYIADKIIEV